MAPKKKTPTSSSEPEAQKPEYRDFKDVYEDMKIEGDKIPPEDLIDGDPFIVHRYHRRHSRFGDGEYVAVEIERDDARYYFNTAARAVMDRLHHTQDALPYRARLVTKQSKAGREYVVLE